MAHSNQVREFVLTASGVDLGDVHLGSGCVLTGGSRIAQESRERASATLREQNHERRLRQLASKRKSIEAQIIAVQAEAESNLAEADFAIAEQMLENRISHRDSNAMFQRRGGTIRTNGNAAEKQ